MKAIRLFVFLVIFLIALVIGSRSGRNFAMKINGAGWQNKTDLVDLTAISNTGIPALANDQRSILILSTDDLASSSPRLKSLWLLVYVPGNPRLMLLPIYPPPSLEAGDSAIYLANVFKMNLQGENTRLDSAFLEAIRKLIPWWSGYIVLDDLSLEAIIDVWNQELSNADSVNRISASADGKEALSKIPAPWEDLLGAVTGQASLYQDLCEATTSIDPFTNIADLPSHVQKHIVSDLNVSLLLDEFRDLYSVSSGFVCEMIQPSNQVSKQP